MSEQAGFESQDGIGLYVKDINLFSLNAGISQNKV